MKRSYVIQDKAGAYWCGGQRWSVFTGVAARWATLLGASNALCDLAPFTQLERKPLSIRTLVDAA